MGRLDSRKKNLEDTPTEVPVMVYVKGFFLISVILMGMFFISRAAGEKNNQSAQESQTEVNYQELAQSFSTENIKRRVEDEIRTNEKYKETVASVRNQTDQVLGEASKTAEVVVEESKEVVTDHIYEYTYGKVVEGLINAMPERQKELFQQRVCGK